MVGYAHAPQKFADRLRQIPPETGRFLALLLANAPAGQIVEIGTSAGYSTLWLSLAAQETNRRIITFERLPDKVRLATHTFRTAQVDSIIELVADDALRHLPGYTQIAFCFLDAEKELYRACYETVVPNLAPGGLLVADNAINHLDTLMDLIEQAHADTRVDALLRPIRKSLLICRRPWRATAPTNSP